MDIKNFEQFLLQNPLQPDLFNQNIVIDNPNDSDMFFQSNQTFIGYRINVVPSEYSKNQKVQQQQDDSDSNPIKGKRSNRSRKRSYLNSEILEQKMGEKVHKFTKKTSDYYLDNDDIKTNTLEDFDKYITKEEQQHTNQMTFVINGEPCYYAKQSLFLFNQDDKFRTKLAEIQNSPLFITLVQLVLLLNLLPFVLYDYKYRIFPEEVNEKINHACYGIELFCDIFFFIEMVINIIVRGFMMEKNTYMRNGYCVVNIVTVFSSMILYVSGLKQGAQTFFKVLLRFRIMRISYMFKSTKKIVDALIYTLPELYKVVMSLIIILLLYATLGLHLFSGAMKHRCRTTPEPYENGSWPLADGIMSLCGNYECPENTYCGKIQVQKYTEYDFEVFNYGFTRYDNIFWSFFSVYLFISTIGWSSVVFIYQRYLNEFFISIFFLSLMLITFFVLVNIMMASLQDGFINREDGIPIINGDNQKNENAIKIQDLELRLQRDQKILHEMEMREKQIRQQPSRLTTMFVGVKTKLSVAQKFVYRFFNLCVNILIISQTIILCMDHHQISDKNMRSLQLGDFVCLMFFLVELIIRILIVGIHEFIPFNLHKQNKQKGDSLHENSDQSNDNHDNQENDEILKQKIEEEEEKEIREMMTKYLNFVDLIIFLLNIFEIIIKSIMGMDPIYEETKIGIFFRIMKSLRLIRLLYFSNYIKPMNNLIYGFFKTLKDVGSILFIILVYGISCCCIGMELFAFRVRQKHEHPLHGNLEEGEPFKINYDTFGDALSAVFLCILNDEWHLSMFDQMRALNIYVCFYWLLIDWTGTLILMKFFLAIFLFKYAELIKERKCLKNIEAEDEEESEKSIQGDQRQSREIFPESEIMFSQENVKNNGTVISDKNNGNTKVDLDVPYEGSQLINHRSAINTKNPHKKKSTDILIIIRQKVKWFIEQKNFNYFILALILLSCLVMILDEPTLDPNSSVKTAMTTLEIVISSIFAVELTLKLIVFGIIFPEGAYLRDFWNCIDFFAIVMAVQAVIFKNTLGNFKALRAIKILQIDSFKIVVISLLKSFPMIIKLFILSITIFIFIALIPLKYLKGSMYSCVNLDQELTENLEFIHEHIKYKSDCFDFGGDWVNSDFHYDNIFSSLLNIFIIATCEGWSILMLQAWDAQGQDLQPQSGHNKYWSIFFIAIFIFGFYMVFNMFIGIMIEQYIIINEAYSPYKGMSQQLKEWEQIKEQILNTKPLKEFKSANDKITQYLHQKIHKESDKFIQKINICIMINFIILMLNYEGQSDSYYILLLSLNNVFVIIFTCESLAKLIVYRKHFFSKGWYIYELLLTLLSVIGMLWQWSDIQSYKHNEIFSLIFDFAQILRIIRLIYQVRVLDKIFSTLFHVLPSLFPVAVLFFLILFIFALFGNTTFSYLKQQKYLDGYNLGFRTFGKSVFTLTRVTSAEMWFLILADTTRQQSPNFTCFDIQTYDDYLKFGPNGCGSNIAYIFFIMFHIMVSIIILNLFIALILFATLESIKLENKAVSHYQLMDIQNEWFKYDPEGTGFVDYVQFWQFSIKMALIYNVKQDEFLDIRNKKIFSKVLCIPIYEHRKNPLFGYKFHDVLLKMTQFSIYIKFGNLKQGSQIVKDTENVNVDYMKTDYNSGDMASIILMQRKIKAWFRKIKQNISNNTNSIKMASNVSHIKSFKQMGDKLLDKLFDQNQFDIKEQTINNVKSQKNEESVVLPQIQQNKTNINNKQEYQQVDDISPQDQDLDCYENFQNIAEENQNKCINSQIISIENREDSQIQLKNKIDALYMQSISNIDFEQDKIEKYSLNFNQSLDIQNPQQNFTEFRKSNSFSYAGQDKTPVQQTLQKLNSKIQVTNTNTNENSKLILKIDEQQQIEDNKLIKIDAQQKLSSDQLINKEDLGEQDQLKEDIHFSDISDGFNDKSVSLTVIQHTHEIQALNKKNTFSDKYDEQYEYL